MPATATTTLGPLRQRSGLVLRKACQSCTRAKRRCMVQLPKCKRCATRGLVCRYDLQPWVMSHEEQGWRGAAARAAATPDAVNEISGCEIVGESWLSHPGTLCWLELARLPDYHRKVVLMQMDPGLMLQTPALPAMQVTVDAETEAYLLEQLRLIPQQAATGRSTPFVHPKAKPGRVSRQLDRMLAAYNNGDLGRKSFREVVETNIAAEDLEGTLASTQSLLLYLSLALDDTGLETKARAENLLPLLRTWIDSLLLSAQDKMPHGLTPWRAWLLAESVRRTILMGFMMGCAHHMIAQGFCWHNLFVESLPFDPRPGLWLAESSHSWAESAGKGRVEEVGEELVSFHEFSVGYRTRTGVVMDDAFMRIILVAHYGKRTIIDGLD